jgi:hypothetical protein
MNLTAREIMDLRDRASAEFRRRNGEQWREGAWTSKMPVSEVVRAARECGTIEEAINKLCRDNAPRA